MRAVLDANVLVSGLLVGVGPSGQLIDLASARRLEMVIPSTALIEAAIALRKSRVKDRYRLTRGRIQRYVDDLREGATIVPVTAQPDAVPGDPRDNHVLAVAVQERCDMIVSGDGHLLELESYQGIPILSPREALTRLRDEDPDAC